MSQNQDIQQRNEGGVAPTPQNTPLNTTVLSSRPAGMGKPTVEDVEENEDEEGEDVGGMNPASLLAQNPALLALAQRKFDSLIGQSSGYIESLPAPVKRRIDGLKGIQVEHSKIESEFQLAILEIEKKFLEKYTPLYDRRLAIISGKVEPTDEEVTAGQEADSDDEEEEEEGAQVTEINDEKEEGKEGDKEITGVPEFWLTALRNHAPISETITDEDEEALKSLTDVRLSYLAEGQPGFKLHFTFAANDFFSDTELTKTYYYQEQVGYGGDFVYDKALGHEIKWKDDKDLTKKIEIKKQRNKTTGKTRVIRKVVPTDSFFNFFKPPQPPTPEDLEADDVDEDELEELDARLEVDYQIGEDFKEKIIPRAVDYFTGKALKYEEDYEDEEIDEFEEDDEDFDEEDEAPAQGNKEDCKQQ